MLIDTGAQLSYIDPQVMAEHSLVVRNLEKTYSPVGANNATLGEVDKFVLVGVKFGNHVHDQEFYIMLLENLGAILGQDFWRDHKPSIVDLGKMPEFSHHSCKNHSVNELLLELEGRLIYIIEWGQF